MTDIFSMEAKEDSEDRDYVVDRSEGLNLDDEYFSRFNNYGQEDKRVRIITPALFGGLMLLVLITVFGIFMVTSMGR